ncbi:MAG: PaaI family thioesterase [Candidatus Nanopelagicales bacterium]
MSSPSAEQSRAAIEAADMGHLGERMGIVWLEVGAERTVARMPVAGNTQPYGLLHGGASAVLAESVGSVAAAMAAGPDRFGVGIELSCSHHRSARDGYVTAVATPLSVGRTLASYQIEITNEAGERTVTARLTCLLRDST